MKLKYILPTIGLTGLTALCSCACNTNSSDVGVINVTEYGGTAYDIGFYLYADQMKIQENETYKFEINFDSVPAEIAKEYENFDWVNFTLSEQRDIPVDPSQWKGIAPEQSGASIFVNNEKLDYVPLEEIDDADKGWTIYPMFPSASFLSVKYDDKDKCLSDKTISIECKFSKSINDYYPLANAIDS